jgi:hypothetical protein
VPVSELRDKEGLQPVFYRWLKEFLENGAARHRARTNHSAEEERNSYLEKKIQAKDAVMDDLMAGARRTKERDWGTLTGVWVPHDTWRSARPSARPIECAVGPA